MRTKYRQVQEACNCGLVCDGASAAKTKMTISPWFHHGGVLASDMGLGGLGWLRDRTSKTRLATGGIKRK